MEEIMTEEEFILGQARGLLILANSAKSRKDTRAYFHYLNRVDKLLKAVEELRSFYEQRAA